MACRKHILTVITLNTKTERELSASKPYCFSQIEDQKSVWHLGVTGPAGFCLPQGTFQNVGDDEHRTHF